jgi:hypothetical protein
MALIRLQLDHGGLRIQSSIYTKKYSTDSNHCSTSTYTVRTFVGGERAWERDGSRKRQVIPAHGISFIELCVGSTPGYDNPTYMTESTLSPIQGLLIWLLGN